MTIPILRFRRTLVALLLAMGGSVVVSGGRVGAAEAPVGLATAASFAVLGGSTVTNTGPSVVSGDLGVHPGTAVVGFPPGTVNNGSIHAADAQAAQAQADLTTAYNDAASRSPTATVTADLAGQTLSPGVYRGPTLALNGTLSLNAQGDPGAVFIFQTGSTLITGPGSAVSLVNGTSPCNVYWQVTSSATLGTNSVFAGTILALTSVTAETGSSVTGRLLARNGAVTLDNNTVNVAGCSAGATAATTTTTNGAAATTSTSTTTAPPTTTTTGAVTPTSTVTPTTSTTLPTTNTTSPTTNTTSLGTLGTVGTLGAGVAGGPAASALSAPAAGAGSGAVAAPATADVAAAGRAVQADHTPTPGVTRLARTGSPLPATTLAGLLAMLLGAVLLRSSRSPAPVRRYRC